MFHPFALGSSIISDQARSLDSAADVAGSAGTYQYRREVCVLLLGTGESGKSTTLKQMQLYHNGGYTAEERYSYRTVIHSNLIESMQAVIEALAGWDMPIPSRLRSCAVLIMSTHVSRARSTPSLDRQVILAVAALWRDQQVKACVMKSHEYQLNDSASYYFDAVERIGTDGYLPTDQDILRSRVKTTGLTEVKFQAGPLKYRVIDVGGQRSERRKWIHAFAGVDVLIFMVAISEYNQMLYEDSDVNRLNEAAGLFEHISNSRWFACSSMILFLNKIDIFMEKLISSPIVDYFSDYEGPSSYHTAVRYMENKFLALYHNGERQPLICHRTCATDSRQLKRVFEAVEESILVASLIDSGIL